MIYRDIKFRIHFRGNKLLKAVYSNFQALLFCICCLLICSCKISHPTNQTDKDALSQVNPFIGTGGHGHTYPGATCPFGMVQLSPDTRLYGWDGCSGYHYSDDTIFGFSHTHLSGTGVSDYGDILLMPVNNGLQIKDSNLEYDDFKSSFLHANEKATPGYYYVRLDKPKVDVSLSANLRSGIHNYIFKDPKEPAVVLDLEHRDELISCDFKIVNNRRIEGHRNSKAWAKDQNLFFVIEFSEDFIDYKTKSALQSKKQSKGIFIFSEDAKEINIKVSLSAVDIEGARKNFASELGDKNFNEVLALSQNLWRKQLNKIDADFVNEDDKVIFYSALYHMMLAPNIYNDVDGRYRGMDMKIHQSLDNDHYTVFSLWDTYRATHPLFTIIEQDRTNDFITSMLQKYEQGGILPIWDLSSCYTGCMIGYHGVSVIADAYIKGIKDYDVDLAFQAVQHSANQDHLGLETYKKQGFISVEEEAESVSKTLEYAYDDWCISQMANALGDDQNHQTFLNRSLNYRNLFDSETKFFRPRINNIWQSPFDPFEVNSHFTEANAWQYSFTATHDIVGLIRLHGGKSNFDAALDKLFTASSKTTGRDQADLTGLIGQYVHGNEPSHHIAYLYNFVNKPWKTQKRVREILDTQYANAPDGISGNEDCGQMSAWYVLSAMGMYSILPGSDYYVFGSPSIKEAKINLENGNTFKINCSNSSKENIYIQSATLNGHVYDKNFIRHQDIMKGGVLNFVMGPAPNLVWASRDEQAPYSKVKDKSFIQSPSIVSGQLSFLEENIIKLSSGDLDSDVFYKLDDGTYQNYMDVKGIVIDTTCTLCVYAQKAKLKSPVICTEFIKRDTDLLLKSVSEYENMYNGGTHDALIDGLRGGKDFRTGAWQGFEGKDMECLLELKNQEINSVSIGFLQDENSWIFFPSLVEFYTSDNGEDFELIGMANTNISPREMGLHIEDITLKVKALKTNFLKIKAKSLIDCPSWHKGAIHGGKAWLFADEIIIK